jgi:hypothetical protein
MAIKGSDNEFPSILVVEQSSKPTGITAGQQRLYVKTDHKLYRVDSAGTETEVAGGATGGAGRLEIGIDGGGAAPVTGVLFDFVVPFDLTITDWVLLADQAGSLVVDLWIDTYANFPPTVTDTVTGSDKPTLSTAAKATSSALTGWTAGWTAGHVVRVNIDSASVLHRATLVLSYTT